MIDIWDYLSACNGRRRDTVTLITTCPDRPPIKHTPGRLQWPPPAGRPAPYS